MTNKPTVLLVDDNIDILVTFVNILQALECDVIPATNGVDAIQKFRTQKSEISVVFLDMQLPDMTGNDVMTEIRTIQPDVPVYIVSGYMAEELARRFNAQPDGFLTKPIELDTIQTIVNQLKDRHAAVTA